MMLSVNPYVKLCFADPLPIEPGQVVMCDNALYGHGTEESGLPVEIGTCERAKNNPGLDTNHDLYDSPVSDRPVGVRWGVGGCSF